MSDQIMYDTLSEGKRNNNIHQSLRESSIIFLNHDRITSSEKKKSFLSSLSCISLGLFPLDTALKVVSTQYYELLYLKTKLQRVRPYGF